jgi:hypothetical protein
VLCGRNLNFNGEKNLEGKSFRSRNGESSSILLGLCIYMTC